MHLNFNSLRVRKDLHGGDDFRSGAVHRQILDGRSVQPLISKGNGPHAVGEVKGEVTQFVRGGRPDQSGIAGRNHFGCFPKREGGVPAGGVVVEVDNAVDGGGRLDVKHAQISIHARVHSNQCTVATVGDNALGGHVVGEARRHTHGEITGEVGHGGELEVA